LRARVETFERAPRGDGVEFRGGERHPFWDGGWRNAARNASVLSPFMSRRRLLLPFTGRCFVMSDLKTGARAAVGRTEPRRALSAPAVTGSGQCLVVSASQAHREILSRSANRGGWDTIVCADDQNALAAFRRTRFQLAIVDLSYFGSTPTAFRELSQTLAAQSGLLLIVCGKESDPQEEIWARQLGVWLYLPGVTPDHADEMTAICEHAQALTGLSAAREVSR
jgi:ActR/RegA family two-component response regulator